MRRPRPYQPASAFHLTTRLHRREALFTPELRTALVGIIREQVFFSDVELLAYAIMPNHFHLVIRQGRAPLHAFMQPIVRRAALLIQRVYKREGYVFERRYRDRPCADPHHLRNAIVYTHLNPVRAGLCTDPAEYAWTSHAAWLGNESACDGRRDPAAVECGLPLFAVSARHSRSELVNDYLAFVKWRIDVDAQGAAGESAALLDAPTPVMAEGDTNWLYTMTPRPREAEPKRALALPGPEASARPDLSELAGLTMFEAKTQLDPAVFRSRWGGPAYRRARHAFIRRAVAAGYKGVQIAAYLHITTQAVSKVLAADRKRLLARRKAA